ncbi:TetR/AcrR family transcriptional regulator [Nocardioides dongxiaopingii]|uniref:TetR/AcrR family transcriptional regulator n=1 Tax=Nocardioides TaxID=1839 RepID=UPI0010C767C8|nr:MULTISPECIES: TetR/AcrR family transcriptional regulator [Nocardioides]QCW49388.1 TetR/AcrR family transcriptional regulator [Nocardioides sp. S-1144]
MARPRDPLIEERILDATDDLIAEHGYAGLTMEAIAERAGVGKPTIYRRYANRDEVVMAVNARASIPVEPVDTGSLLGDIQAVVRGVVPTVNTPTIRATLGPQVGRAIADDAANRVFQDTVGGSSDVYMRPIWQRGLDRGEIDPDLDYLVARTALGTAVIFSLTLYRLDDSCVDQIARMWVRSVAPPPER